MEETLTGVISSATRKTSAKTVGDLTEREQMVVGCETLNRVCFLFSFLFVTIVTASYMTILVNYSESKLNP